jgi:hypothetical protein
LLVQTPESTFSGFIPRLRGYIGAPDLGLYYHTQLYTKGLPKGDTGTGGNLKSGAGALALAGHGGPPNPAAAAVEGVNYKREFKTMWEDVR